MHARSLRRLISFLRSIRVPVAIALALAMVIVLIPTPAAAFFGLNGLLNPEGSRLFPQTFLFPRHPGKPDLRWRSFDWKFVDVKTAGSAHRLYFYDEEEWAAKFTLPRIRNQVEFLSGVFNYTPSKKFDYLLFTSYREFQQANIFNISEGVQGITATTEASMAIPYWGETETFRHISTHEMVHQFQVQKVNDLAQYYAPEVLSLVPLWFIEGMAEYYSQAGMDPEARMFLRDLVLNPEDEDKDKKPKLPSFFENGPMSFAYIYKLGQAKIHFLETRYGQGTAQKILEKTAKTLARQQILFDGLASQVVGRSPKGVQKDWEDYLIKTYQEPAKEFSQTLKDFEQVKLAGETLDIYDVSPDGRLMAVREIDPLTYTTAITLIDLKNKERILAARDQNPGIIGLYFMQVPSLALGNNKIVYAVATTDGPEIEIREIFSKSEGKGVALGPARRIRTHESKLLQVSSPALSPDEKRLVFVGLTPNGWQNLYTVELESRTPLQTLKKLTNDYYSWKTPVWSSSGKILVSSDRTDSARYSLYSVDPETGDATQLTSPTENQLQVNLDFTAPGKQRILYQSWSDGTSQIHAIQNAQETRLTDIQTGVMLPKQRGKELYVLGFMKGRYQVYKVPPKQLQNEVIGPVKVTKAEPWKARVLEIPSNEVGSYRPFLSSGTRLENIFGFFGTGNVGGISATVTDLMRNYSFTGELAVLGDFRQTNLNLFLSSQKGRATWVVGGYHIIQPRLDNVFMNLDDINTYLHREFGALGSVQYPLGAFSYFDIGVRLAGVKRSDFSDDDLEDEWNEVNPGVEFMAAPTLRLGYDRVLYELFSGPLRGFGALLEADTSFFPSRSSVTERLRLDLSYYIQAVQRSVIALQAVGGASWGGSYRNPFFVSSDDIIRAYPFGDDRLLGNYVLAAKAEFRFPIGSLFGFQPLRGLIGYDYGTIFRRTDRISEGVASATTGGLSLNIPPLAINLMLSFPGVTAPGPRDSSVFHFTLRYLYL